VQFHLYKLSIWPVVSTIEPLTSNGIARSCKLTKNSSFNCIKWIEYSQLGGEQETKRRAGTESVPQIVGMTKALEIACSPPNWEYSIGVLFFTNKIPTPLGPPNLWAVILMAQLGGEQETKRRAGTESVPQIVGMTKALEIATKI
jgi:hypothetical protein